MTDLHRIGDKLISRDRIMKTIDRLLALRQTGVSQAEVAIRLGTDRSLVSRLERLGEIRKGGRLAVLGFPVVNKGEIVEVTRSRGVDFVFVLDEQERWSFLEGKSGLELFAEAVALFERIRGHDVVIILGHNRPAGIMAALVERTAAVFHLSQADGREAWFDPGELAGLIDRVKG